MKIAIVGTGISGLVSAYLLSRRHEVTVFEAGDRVGGHTHTVGVELNGTHYDVDTGFIVYNDWTYPHFIELISQLGVESKPTEMSFSVKAPGENLEYNGTSLNKLFAQRRNLLRPTFHRMIREILRFNREAPAILDGDGEIPLGSYLEEQGYSRSFVDHYIVPMGASIWSARPGSMMEFPARFFVRFLKNHGMLSVDERPQWRVIRGGSSRYVAPLTAGFAGRIRVETPVRSVRRGEHHVEITADGAPERFDWVVIATHSDQASRILDDPSPEETSILGDIPYQKNEVVLHTDSRLLPRRRRAWAAWNYLVPEERGETVTVTYNMNILQGILAPETFCVSLNQTEAIDPDRVIARMVYDHPVFTSESVAAQARHSEISGVRRTSYCGAYWRYGFHEDGVWSALRVCKPFGEEL